MESPLAHKNPIYILPPGVASFPYLLEPDSKAPEGVAFKADNKYKVSVQFDSEDGLGPIHDAITEAAIEKFGKMDFDDFAWPWKSHGDDHKKDYLKNKTVLTAKSQFKPAVVDAKRQPLPAGVEVRGGDIVKIAVTLYLYEKTEKVKVGKKIEDVLTRGCSLQLAAVQLIEKRAGAGSVSGDVFDEEEGYCGGDAPDLSASADF